MIKLYLSSMAPLIYSRGTGGSYIQEDCEEVEQYYSKPLGGSLGGPARVAKFLFINRLC